jgi:hypothetical protein
MESTGRQNRSCLRGEYQWEEGELKEREWEGKYGGNVLYTFMKMEK